MCDSSCNSEVLLDIINNTVYTVYCINIHSCDPF